MLARVGWLRLELSPIRLDRLKALAPCFVACCFRQAASTWSAHALGADVHFNVPLGERLAQARVVRDVDQVKIRIFRQILRRV